MAKTNGSTARLGVILRAKRRAGDLRLKQVTEQTGISPSTLSRLERGAMPDTETVVKLSRWLGVSVGDMLMDEQLPRFSAQEMSTPEKISVLLRADTKLSAKAAIAMTDLFCHLYDILVTEDRAL